MALVFTPIDNQDVRGRYKARLCTAAIASYTVGGEAVTDTHALQAGLRRIVGMDIEDGASSNGVAWKYDQTVPEIRCYESGTASASFDEQDNTNDCGVVRVLVYGD